jgi:hypothetical protein
VEHDLDVFALTYLRELRFGEARVHHYLPGAEFSARGHRDDEAAMVTAEQAHDRTSADTEPLESAGERGGHVVYLLVGQGPALVHNRGQ